MVSQSIYVFQTNKHIIRQGRSPNRLCICTHNTRIHAYLHAHIQTGMHIHPPIHPSIHPCMHACIHTFTCLHIYLHTYMLTYLHTYATLQYIAFHSVTSHYVALHPGMHTYIHTKTHNTYIHTYIHTYMHTYIHSYIHTQGRHAYMHTYRPSSYLHTSNASRVGAATPVKVLLTEGLGLQGLGPRISDLGFRAEHFFCGLSKSTVHNRAACLLLNCLVRAIRPRHRWTTLAITLNGTVGPHSDSQTARLPWLLIGVSYFHSGGLWAADPTGTEYEGRPNDSWSLVSDTHECPAA